MPSVIRGGTLRVDLTELKSRLALLGQRMATNVVRRGILAGMGVIRTDARARAVAPRRGKRASKGKTAGKTKGKSLRRGRPAGGWPKGTWATGALKKMISSETNTIRGSDGKNAKVTGRVFIRQPMKKGQFELLAGDVAAGLGDFAGAIGRNPRRYAHLVEFGVAPHAVGKGSKRKKKGKAAANQTGILHPGHAPRPFMRPAWDAKQAEAAKKIEVVMRAELEKEIKKLAKGGGKS